LLLKAIRDTAGVIVDFECVQANGEMLDDDQTDSGQFIGARLRDLLPGRASADLLNEFIHCAETGEDLDLDSFVYTDGDGSPIRRVAIRCARVGDVLSYSWHESPDDFELRNNLAFAASHSADVVVTLDLDNKFTWLSPSAERVLGWRMEDLAGRSEIDFVEPDDRMKILADRTALEHDASIEIRVPDVAGASRWMIRRSSALVDSSGNQIGTVLTLRDIDAEVQERGRHVDAERLYHALVNDLSDIAYRADQDGLITWVAPTLSDAVGLRLSELIGKNVGELFHPDDVVRRELAVIHLFQGEIDEAELRLRTPEGEYRWTRVRTHPIIAEDGKITGQIGTLRDLQTETESVDTQIDEVTRRAQLESDADVVFRASSDTIVEWVSPAITTLAGWLPEQVIGHRIADFVVPDDWPNATTALPEVIGRSSASFQGRLITASGGFRWVSIRTDLLFGEKGQTVGAAVNLRDVHDEVVAREVLSESEQRFRLAMESAPIGMAVVDLKHQFIEVNPALCEMLGRNEAWLTSHSVPDVLGADDDGLELFVRAATLSGRIVTPSLEKPLYRPDGSAVWVELSVGTVRDQSGLPVSYVSTFVDVTKTKATREELTYLATHDVLTRLVNRRDLYDRVDDVMSHTRRSGTHLGALFIDVDNLKLVNDTYGHSVGDQALVELADRLTSMGRNDDVISRIGGDEFVILLPWLHSVDDAELVAARVLSSLEQPIEADMADIQLSVSIGVAFAAGVESADEILRQADAALYRAKKSGKSQWVTYDQRLDRGFVPQKRALGS
jgi:diguanylate cyclase (GGDEF)-like protein/PAS domain S-box-containing protein